VLQAGIDEHQKFRAKSQIGVIKLDRPKHFFVPDLKNLNNVNLSPKVARNLPQRGDHELFCVPSRALYGKISEVF
jgi:hypothetical protein